MSLSTKLKQHHTVRNLILLLSGIAFVYGIISEYMWLIAGLALLNLYAIILMSQDKRLAKKSHGFRIPESSFYLLAFCYASLGIVMGMSLFHHKTQRLTFRLIPLLIPLQAWLLYLLYQYV